jgi:hypothetical protein
MIIPLDKLLVYNENRYTLTRAAMEAVDRVANISTYPEDGWKLVPNILKLVLNNEVKYHQVAPGEENSQEEDEKTAEAE